MKHRYLSLSHRVPGILARYSDTIFKMKSVDTTRTNQLASEASVDISEEIKKNLERKNMNGKKKKQSKPSPPPTSSSSCLSPSNSNQSAHRAREGLISLGRDKARISEEEMDDNDEDADFNAQFEDDSDASQNYT